MVDVQAKVAMEAGREAGNAIEAEVLRRMKRKKKPRVTDEVAAEASLMIINPRAPFVI